MIKIDKFKVIFVQILIFLICLLTSFTSYCINQIIEPCPLPFTAIPIIILTLFFHKPFSMTLIFIGILDDCFTNFYIGFFPFCYLALTSIILNIKKYFSNK
ncbi:MAG: hypothetical protein LBF70_00625 [Holosporales bacterium]|nr:hypothetical protein [Holosporales bacterium]